MSLFASLGRRSAPLVLAACGLWLWLSPPTSHAQAPAAALGAPTSAFKDLQQLPKNISKDELKKTMKQMAKDLGVDCDHCHKEPNMFEDTPKKLAAREMMKMTYEVNAKYKALEKKVTCFTCHRGKAEPENKLVGKPPGGK